MIRAAFWLAAGLMGSVAQAQLSPWRVCVPDAAFPPFLNNDAGRLGVTERLIVEAARRAGLSVQWAHLPYRRCVALVREGKLDALIAPAASAAPGLQFPRRANGELDSSRQLAQVALVWMQNAGGGLQWDGKVALGLPNGSSVGMRSGMQAGVGKLKNLGFKVDQTARDASQLLRMLQNKRLPAVVLLEAEYQGVAHAFKGIEVLPRPLQVEPYYLVASVTPGGERHTQLTEWWRQIGLLRDSAEFRP